MPHVLLQLMKLLDDDKCPDIVEWLPDVSTFVSTNLIKVRSITLTNMILSLK
jgi:hypothetical protein